MSLESIVFALMVSIVFALMVSYYREMAEFRFEEKISKKER